MRSIQEKTIGRVALSVSFAAGFLMSLVAVDGYVHRGEKAHLPFSGNSLSDDINFMRGVPTLHQ
jgi:hypothetical protein